MSRIEKRINIHGEGRDQALTVEGYKYSPTNILLHLERLKGLKVIAKKSWLLTDDFEAYFIYKDHLFVLYTPFSEVVVEPASKNVPVKIIKEVFNHIKEYRIVWIHRSILGVLKYVLLPFNPKL